MHKKYRHTKQKKKYKKRRHAKIMLIPLKNIWHTKLNKRSRKQAIPPISLHLFRFCHPKKIYISYVQMGSEK